MEVYWVLGVAIWGSLKTAATFALVFVSAEHVFGRRSRSKVEEARRSTC